MTILTFVARTPSHNRSKTDCILRVWTDSAIISVVSTGFGPILTGRPGRARTVRRGLLALPHCYVFAAAFPDTRNRVVVAALPVLDDRAVDDEPEGFSVGITWRVPSRSADVRGDAEVVPVVREEGAK